MSHQYPDTAYACYDVTLTVTDSSGATHSESRLITVAADYLAATQPSGALADGYRYEFWPVDKKTAVRVSHLTY